LLQFISVTDQLTSRSYCVRA